jgi:hypothetical protein
VTITFPVCYAPEIVQNIVKSRSPVKINYVLPQKYADLGFKLLKIGKESLAISYQGKTIFIFSSAIDARDEFISRLCDCRLKLNSYARVPGRN